LRASSEIFVVPDGEALADEGVRDILRCRLFTQTV
jgi:hypothetical protein